MAKSPPFRESDVYVSLNNIKTIMIMNRNIRQSLLAPALLLLAAATLGLAGCTQGEDALQGADGNAGARTLNINVGPKQGFLSGDADSNTGNTTTRSTVDESTGAVSWQEGDRIFVLVGYIGVTPSRYCYTLVRTATDTWNVYNDYIGTHDESGNAVDLAAHDSHSAIPVPLGATGVSYFIAQHTDNSTYINDKSDIVLRDGGSRDYLRQKIENPAMGAAITLNLAHSDITRLHFPGGLTPGKKYHLGYPILHSIQVTTGGLSFATDTEILFTAAPDGSLTLCALINGTSQTITLKEADTDAVVYTATFNVAYGSSYRCIIPVAGGVNPDSKPDLLKPDPVVPGNKVYAMNGYWVTAPDADAAKKYPWDAANNATTGPCVGHGDWRMPAMKDFEKMLDWSGIPSWADSEDVIQRVDLSSGTEYTIWDTAFPCYSDNEYQTFYWSSDSRQVGNNAWSLFRDGPSGYIKYSIDTKASSYHVRCVQPQ